MKTSEAEVIVWLIFVLSSLGSAILTGYEEHHDITDDRRLGCDWKGGSTSALICTCREDAEEMYITRNSIDAFSTSAIIINDCKSVRFGENSVRNMSNLRAINLTNIRSVHFEKSSLIWYNFRDFQDKHQYEDRFDPSLPSLKIKIENSNISQLSEKAFEGRISYIEFDNVTVENIDPFAFHALIQSQSIVLKNVELKHIRDQPFKKFSTEYLELNGVRAQMVPSRFLNNLTVYTTFKIMNCVFETVRPGGFIVHNPTYFEVSDTKIDHLDGDAFTVTTKGDVLFRNNVFNVINDGAFHGIVLSKDKIPGGTTITFDSNVFTTLTRDSLSINEEFRPKFSNLKLNQSCDCKDIDRKIKDAEFYAEIKCLYDDEFVTVQEYKSNMCSIIQSYSTVIIIVVIVLTLSFIVITVLVVYYRKVYLSKKYGNEKNPKNGNMSLIVPDGRTYRETELHVIVERADLLTTDL